MEAAQGGSRLLYLCAPAVLLHETRRRCSSSLAVDQDETRLRYSSALVEAVACCMGLAMHLTTVVELPARS